MENFFLAVLKITGLQLVAVFGFFLVTGFVLSVLQTFTQKQYYQSIGWLGILWTAWIGTPIHELSHYLVAKLFFHRIDSVSLFKPNHQSGKLGEVLHSYNPRNWFQQIGNFFIGAAPLLGGVLVLWLLFIWLLPNSAEVRQAISQLQLNVASLTSIFKTLFSSTNLHNPRFWLFIYLSFAVASHLAPSPVDQKSMWRGLVWLIALLLIINSMAELLHRPLVISVSPGFLTWLFWYALVVSAVHALISFVIFLPFRRR